MKPLAGAVSDFIRLRSPEPEAYNSESGPLSPGAAPGAALAELYRRTVSLSDDNPTLHLFAVVPLYEAEAEETVCALADEAAACVMPVTLCVIGLRGWLANAAENSPAAPSRADDAAERARISGIAGKVGSLPVPASFCVLDDFLDNNAPVNFDFTRLARFLGEFFTAVMSNYPALFPPVVYQQAGAVMGLGLASVEFTRPKFEEFLMSKAFASALKKAGVTEERVNLSKADAAAADALRDIPGYYARLYARHVEHPAKLGKTSNEINDEISAAIEKDRKAIASKLASVVFADGRSMPEREATLALILGKDNRYLRGMTPNLDCIFDDSFAEPLEVFLQASKSARAWLGLDRDVELPIRGDYPELCYPPVGRDDKGKPVPDPRNSECFNPLADIKRLRLEIIELSAWIRRSNERLEKLMNTQRARGEALTVLNEEGTLVVPAVWRRASAPEEPLSEKYAPRPGLTLPPSVDLRRFFGPAVSQGELGACSSFATAALYEGLANRLNPDGEKRLKLSEAYLFYHSNILTGKKDEGSNFSEQFAILAKAGACRGELYEYSDRDPDREPGADATADAQEHRLLRALEVPLERTGRKFEDMEKNHTLITSALAEGFPVGLSLRIPEKFGASGPYIGRPTDAEIAEGALYNHAMAIVGYDEQAKIYIVRNSWGKDFGDEGYCYVSAAYIDDPALNNFCCIIERTTDTESAAEDSPLPVVAKIAGTETEVEIRSIRNALEYANIQLDGCTAEFAAAYRYFTNLIDILSMPRTRRNLLGFLKSAIASDISELRERETDMRNNIKANRERQFRIFWSGNAFVALIAGGITLLCTMATWDDGGKCFLAAGAAALGWLLFMLIFYFSYWKPKKDRDYKDAINELAEAILHLERREESLEMRFFAAGAVLDMLKDIRQELEGTYVRLSSFVSNLRLWHKEYEKRSLALDLGDDPKFRVLGDRDVLLAYFRQYENNIASTFDFMAAFRSFEVRPEGLAELRRSMEDSARGAVARSFGPRYFAAHLTASPPAPYLPEVDLAETMARLNRMSQAMLRHVGATPSETRIVVASHSNLTAWGERIRRHFSTLPTIVPTHDPDRITLITQIFLPPEDVM